MHRVVFYLWQSDLPNGTNRSFIEQALKKVTKAISIDNSIDVEPVVDRDTQGVAGSPDIVKTIFQKIEKADVVVADVSLINSTQQGRPTPNPNVLLELGYALHSLGDERVVLVFNTTFGKIEDLPFDLRMRRVTPYCSTESAQERPTERKALESKLDDAIRAALGSVKPAPTVSLVSEAIDSIERVVPSRVIAVRKVQAEFLKRLQSKQPTTANDGGTSQDILDAIASTSDIAVDFTEVAAATATMGDEESARALHRGFGPLLEAYYCPSGSSAKLYPSDFDFIKFVGHELYTTFIACLIREGRWELITNLLAQGIPVSYSSREQGPANCGFDQMSQHLESFSRLNEERPPVYLHLDLLKARHEQDPLGHLMPLNEFIAADYFLFLKGELSTDEMQTFFAWRPWSTVFMQRAPHFLLDARHAPTAQRIAAALGVADVEMLKQRLREPAGRLRKMWGDWWDQPLRESDIDRISTS